MALKQTDAQVLEGKVRAYIHMERARLSTFECVVALRQTRGCADLRRRAEVALEGLNDLMREFMEYEPVAAAAAEARKPWPAP